MKRTFLSAVALSCLAHPAIAEPPFWVAYALGDGAQMGLGVWSGDKAKAEEIAVNGCGGGAVGCEIVLSVRADCVAMSQSFSSAGYWFWVAYTDKADPNGRNRELGKLQDQVMGWCKDSAAPAGTCEIRDLRCMDYIGQLN